MHAVAVLALTAVVHNRGGRAAANQPTSGVPRVEIRSERVGYLVYALSAVAAGPQAADLAAETPTGEVALPANGVEVWLVRHHGPPRTS